MKSLSRELPYFRWYPGDAQSDLKYRSLTRAERGLFHDALDLAWTSNGLPDDDSAVGRALGMTVREVKELWLTVRECFPVSEDGKRRNKRQEIERAEAIRLSEARSKAGSVGGKRSAVVKQTLIKPQPRAYESESDTVFVSGFDFESKKKTFLAESSIFPDWWELWSKVRGTHHSREALQAWMSVVPMDLEGAAIECTASYLGSLDNPAKGFNPDTFLFAQAKEGFESRWPAFAPRNGHGAARETRAQRLAREMDEEAAG